MRAGRRARVLAALLAASSAAAQPMPTAEAAEIERACSRLFLAYAAATDANEAAGIYSAYAEDGVIRNPRATVKGRAAIEAFFKQRVPERIASGFATRHVVTNILITPIDHDHARGTAYETMYRFRAGGPKRAGDFEPALLATIRAEFVRTAEGWRFSLRDTEEISRQD